MIELTPWAIGWICIAVVFVLLIIGIPVAIALAVVGFLGFWAINGLEPALGIGEQQVGGLLDAQALTDAAEQVLKGLALGAVEMDVIDGSQRHPKLGAEGRGAPNRRFILGLQMPHYGHGKPRAEYVAKHAGRIARRPGAWQQQGMKARGKGGQVVWLHAALALGRAALARGQQAAEVAIALTIHGIEADVGPVNESDAGADQELEAAILGGFMGANHAAQGVPIGDGQRVNAQRDGLPHEFIGMASAPQKAEVGAADQFRPGQGMGGPRRRTQGGL